MEHHVKTWDDIRIAALHDPMLQALVHHVDRGVPKETALIITVLALSAYKDVLQEQATLLLMHEIQVR